MLLYFINMFHATVLINVIPICCISFQKILNLTGKQESVLVYFKISHFSLTAEPNSSLGVLIS